MSRTANHLNYRKAREAFHDEQYRRYISEWPLPHYPYWMVFRRALANGQHFTTRTLRYSAAEIAKAAEERRRPAPTTIHRSGYAWWWSAPIARPRLRYYRSRPERSARQKARSQIHTVRGLYNSGTGVDDLPDVEAYRPRNSAKWEAW